ncbi:hypothetical protein ACFLX9_03600 [Chloroflexota bacterium]
MSRHSTRVGDIDLSGQSQIRFLGKEPVFLGGVNLSLKRGISVWVVTQGWNYIAPPLVAVAA